MSLEAGARLGPYRIDGKLGQGGMGVVYSATDTRLQRAVAVKVLSAAVTADATGRARFEKEARLAAAVTHPNIATVHDVGEVDGSFYIVMERVDGESLRRRLDRGPLGVDETVELARQIAGGLAHAHGAGIVHRDLKPDNIVLTADGRPKILDFGLGKLVVASTGITDLSRAATVAADTSDHLTREGQVVGTLAYMSPEQLESAPVDARSDLFSLGVVMYEMLAGRRPFEGTSSLSAVTATLRDAPPPLDGLRADVPVTVQAVIDRCLEKDPEARFASARELAEALTATRRAVAASPGAGLGGLLRRPLLVVPALLLLLAGVATTAWIAWGGARAARIQDEVIPEIERLRGIGDNDAALRLIAEARTVLPDDPRLEQLELDATFPVVRIDSDPPGAELFIKAYTAPDREWRRVGVTPIGETRLPMSAMRYRITLDGYAPLEGAVIPGRQVRFELRPLGEIPEGMVFVSAGPAGFADQALDLPAFFMDRDEVSRAEYKAFLDAGGYRDPQWWPETAEDEHGNAITRKQLMARLVDTTGRPGPAGWELGAYPEGTGDLPVGGVSWYEARAYAAWAGKSLPTVFHWQRAVSPEPGYFSDILVLSNFSGEGPLPVGSTRAVSAFGTRDMAGNAREWCLNAGNTARYILGGGWPDPPYLFRNNDARAPLDRDPANGFRCVKSGESPPPGAAARIDAVTYDFRADKPVDDAMFEVLRRQYDYDPVPLEPRVDAVDDSRPYWRQETVSIRAAYGGERLPVHLFIPKNVAPPYQAVVYAPGGGAFQIASSRDLRLTFASFVPRSGRVLAYPVYKGTYERQVENTGVNAWREQVIQIAKDLRRAVDYLEKRDDIDGGKMAFYGISFGAGYGPLFTAVETRLATSVLLVGGLSPTRVESPPEIRPLNFAPRSTLPVLMLNARNDFLFDLETEVRPFFELQGAPPADKRLHIFEGGHIPDDTNDIVREVLDWLDTRLGPVTPAG